MGEGIPRSAAARFLLSAHRCRTRDLEQLSILGGLVRELSELIHSLQKERGASSIFLGSGGSRFTDQLQQRIGECRALELTVRERLEHIDQKLDRMSSGARFYTRVAQALQALDSVPELRRQIAAHAIAPQDSVRAFTAVIGRLLAVGFEVGDVAADPAVSRALVALVNFAQAKEYAGQERATVGAALSAESFHPTDASRMQQLIAAQNEALRIFTEFSDASQADAYASSEATPDALEVERMRRAINQTESGGPPPVSADEWYRHTTRRIDGLHSIENELSRQLGSLCDAKLAQARGGEPSEGERSDAVPTSGPLGVILADADPLNSSASLESGIGLYSLDTTGPKPMRSILHVIQAQSRKIDDVSAQLETARAALDERKTVDRAKNLLMTSRNLSETAAYTLMRETAMRQNKRIVEIAKSIITMADILKA